MTPSPLSNEEIDAIKERLHRARSISRTSRLERDFFSSDIAALLAHINHLEEQLSIRSPHSTGEADPVQRDQEDAG